MPAWTHAALNSSNALTEVYAELRKNIGVVPGRTLRVATALPNSLSPMPTVMDVLPEVRYVVAAIYSKTVAAYALVGKNTADHVYMSLPDSGGHMCLKHGGCSCQPGAVDILLSSPDCSLGVIGDVEPSLVGHRRSLATVAANESARIIYVYTRMCSIIDACKLSHCHRGKFLQ